MDFNSYRHFLGFGDFSDLYFVESNHLAIKWEEEKINSISQEEMSGVGLRYLNGQETRFINATCPAPMSRNLTETDRHLLQNLQDQLSSGLPRFTPSSLRGTVTASYGIQKPSVQISLKEKIALMKRAFQAAQVGPHIRQVTINYGEKIKKVGYVNSEGESFIEKRCYLVFSMTVTVERNGDLQTAYDSMGGLVGWELFNGGSYHPGRTVRRSAG
jgi:TldD protein